jgi:hypothetical protein
MNVKPAASPDDLLKTGEDGTIELTENALDAVTGGRKAGEGQKDFLKITMKEVFITSVTPE